MQARLMRREGGFSMVELLVAVLVLSIAMLAAFRVFGSAADAAAALRARTLAEIVAQNRAAELQLGEAPGGETVEMGGRRWQVTTEQAVTEAGFAKVAIRVTPGNAALIVWLDPAVDQ